MLLRRIPDRNIWVIYAAILLLGVAYGVSIAVLAIHLKAHDIPKVAMGGLAAAFALGIVLFSIPTGSIVQRFGAKRTIVAGLLGYSVCVGSFPFLSTTAALSIARFFDGAFSVSIWIAAETALLSRSNKTNKAFVMSLYAMSLAVGYIMGPILATGVVKVAGTGGTFVVAGILACAAAVVILLRLDSRETDEHEDDAPATATATATASPADLAVATARIIAGDGALAPSQASAKSDAKASPEPLKRVPLSVKQIVWRTKTSCFGTFSYGYFQASVVIFLPLFLIETKNIAESKTILITAFFAAGMLISSTLVSRLGDRYGHLLVMRALAAIGALTVASFVLLSSFGAMCAAVFVAGGTLAAISPVSLALQGVIIPRRDLGRANAFYNAAYAAGMLLGPVVSSVIFTRKGGGEMLLHLSVLWGTFVLFTLVFAADDPKHAQRRARAKS